MDHIGHDLLLDVLEHPLEVFALLGGFVWNGAEKEREIEKLFKYKRAYMLISSNI